MYLYTSKRNWQICTNNPKDGVVYTLQTEADSLYLLYSTSNGHHGGDHGPSHDEHAHVLDRCQGLEMDAAAVNELGEPYFFKSKSLRTAMMGRWSRLFCRCVSS